MLCSCSKYGMFVEFSVPEMMSSWIEFITNSTVVIAPTGDRFYHHQ